MFIGDRLHTPYFIFVKCGAKLSDTEMLNRFGLPTYRPTESYHRGSRCAGIADDGEWKMIADDWSYTLWHMPSTRETIAELGRSFEVFACSRGDADDSFDFESYQGGQLVRRYVVECPNWGGPVVVENTGEPLAGETAEMMAVGQLPLLLANAHSLGIRTDYKPDEVRVYAPPPRTTRAS